MKCDPFVLWLSVPWHLLTPAVCPPSLSSNFLLQGFQRPTNCQNSVFFFQFFFVSTLEEVTERDVISEWHIGRCLTTSSSVAFANFYGVNTPAWMIFHPHNVMSLNTEAMWVSGSEELEPANHCTSFLGCFWPWLMQHEAPCFISYHSDSSFSPLFCCFEFLLVALN